MCVCVSAGFSQGVRRSIGGLATILGPLWAGGLTGNLYVMLGMMLFLLTLIMVSECVMKLNTLKEHTSEVRI